VAHGGAARWLGGWSRGRNGTETDEDYDHGDEVEGYIEAQRRVTAWLVKKGYLGTSA
jgi:hypothetical protein